MTSRILCSLLGKRKTGHDHALDKALESFFGPNAPTPSEEFAVSFFDEERKRVQFNFAEKFSSHESFSMFRGQEICPDPDINGSDAKPRPAMAIVTKESAKQGLFQYIIEVYVDSKLVFANQKQSHSRDKYQECEMRFAAHKLLIRAKVRYKVQT